MTSYHRNIQVFRMLIFPLTVSVCADLSMGHNYGNENGLEKIKRMAEK